MQFRPIASSSKGNVYLVRSENVAPLLLEAGIPMTALRKELYSYGVMITDLAACLCSHEHL